MQAQPLQMRAMADCHQHRDTLWSGGSYVAGSCCEQGSHDMLSQPGNLAGQEGSTASLGQQRRVSALFGITS